MYIKLKKSIPDLFILLLGIIVLLIIPYEINSTPGNNTGPRFFPYLLSGLIALLSIMLILTSVFKKSVNSNANKEDVEVTENRQYLRVVLIIGCAFIWMLLIPILGVTIPTFLTTFLSMWILGERKAKSLIFIPFLLTITIYYVFAVILSVRFPDGLFY